MSDAAPALLYGVNWWSRANAILMADEPVEAAKHADDVLRAAASGRPVMVWASRMPPGLVEAAARGGARLTRIEDGFVRSPGLGAHFAPAYSLIFDDAGVYYDPTRASGLERLLATHVFDGALLDRAAALRQRLVAGAVSKYAVGRGPRPESPPGRARVLVVGQVADDASVRLGGGGVAGNLDLLERARAASPSAWIAYKPHPDVLRAGRKGHVSASDLSRVADAVWPDVAIADALDWAETVHVISSLAGFEALLRQKSVVVHGAPFYQGWGLTEDLGPTPARRGRALPLDALVAATLILYPRYLDPFERRPVEIEDLLARIEGGWTDPLVGRPRWHRAAAVVKATLGPFRRWI